MIFGMVARAAADGRPLVVLYFSDFDPAGWQMSIRVARKVQALRDLRFTDLKAQVHHAGLTCQQAIDLGLPSTPLKEGERRGDHWREIWGREQTEIDAAIALEPEKLVQIVRDCVCCHSMTEPLSVVRGMFGARGPIARPSAITIFRSTPRPRRTSATPTNWWRRLTRNWTAPSIMPASSSSGGKTRSMPRSRPIRQPSLRSMTSNQTWSSTGTDLHHR